MREIKYTIETLEREGSGWMVQHYIWTLPPWHKVQGYIMRKVQNHPFANKRGYVPEHRLIMEEQLGRFLVPRKELIHHIDGNRENNALSNLKLTSPIEHPRGHVGERNPLGQTITLEPIFQELKFRLLNKNTGECRAYTLSELIGKTYRRGQFSFRGRFTGLKDKNGREMYEGDILRPKEYLTGEGLQVVEWCGDIAGFSLTTGLQFDECDGIVGNIYENPELLEER